MRLVFCADPLQPNSVDMDYQHEAQEARALGLPYDLISFEALVHERDAERAIRLVKPVEQEELAVFRGWMMKPEQYLALHEALAARGLRLINDPVAYRHAHYLPESFDAIAAHSPASVWLKLDDGFTIETVKDALRLFGERAVLLKDYVKSRKHDWDTACFIPSAADWAAVERTVRRFIELQGPDLIAVPA